MDVTTAKLRSGEELVIRVMEPPLLGYAKSIEGSELLDWCWPQIREEMLAGEMREWLFAPYSVGELNGKLVASMCYYAPEDTRDVGVVEFVETVEEQRGKGIASALMARLIDQFRADRGLALYLCTDNPIAGTLYENHGFSYLVGDGMRYLAPGAQDFDTTYLAFGGKARIRDATWADLPRTSVLYNHPEPAWFIKDYFTQSFGNMRYESHFVKLMRRVENRMGAFVVLETVARRVVGAAAVERFDTYFEQHAATLSFRVAPGYLGQAAELLQAAAERAQALSIRTLQVYVADRDDDQKQLVSEAGLSPEARLRDRLRDGDGWMDMLVYTLTLSGDAPPDRSADDYYGSRYPWQTERVAARPER